MNLSTSKQKLLAFCCFFCEKSRLYCSDLRKRERAHQIEGDSWHVNKNFKKSSPKKKRQESWQTIVQRGPIFRTLIRDFSFKKAFSTALSSIMLTKSSTPSIALLVTFNLFTSSSSSVFLQSSPCAVQHIAVVQNNRVIQRTDFLQMTVCEIVLEAERLDETVKMSYFPAKEMGVQPELDQVEPNNGAKTFVAIRGWWLWLCYFLLVQNFATETAEQVICW